MFSLLPAERTGIDFANTLSYTESFNPYTYRNFYNGGGVGLGDVNSDGLLDIFFCGNLVDNRLYLNRGDFRFEDITGQAGVASPGVWSSGVSFADVNGDGRQDIYVCKSGSPAGDNRHNELFINNGPDTEGTVTFTERAAEYGVDDLGLSTHAAFFDYDRDGDLDMYLLNNSIRSVGGYDLRPGQREIRDTLGGNKLYQNRLIETGMPRFVDVSEQANIYGSNIGFGLGVTIGDVNRDGWPDIYVSNDFFERDYLYINNRDGAFTEALEEQMREISLSSMGADMADLTNDGYPEIFVTDMLPEDDARYKTKTTFENWDKYQLNLRNGYFRQFTRNVLQRNNTDGTFSEIGRLAGVEATDWSWGALIADLDNNGWNDLFVANGIYKDLTDQDYINFYSDPNTVRELLKREQAVIERMIDTIPSQPLPNYAFANDGSWPLVNRAAEWGLAQPGFSNGSAYGDLDNDGDLDLVINNVDMPAFVYRNEAAQEQPAHHWLQLRLEGEAPNTLALGAQVMMYQGEQVLFREVAPMRGFQSCVDPRPHFGLGEATAIDSLIVRWPDDRRTVLTEVPVDRQLTLRQAEAGPAVALSAAASPPTPVFERITNQLHLDYRHRENEFVDFDRDHLLYYMLSAEGPKIATADVNGDGREDFYVGGAKDAPGVLFLQTTGRGFRPSPQPAFEADRLSEDSDCLFFDADGDGDVDLYVASGGNEFPASSAALADRLYLNDGKGRFTRSEQILPTFRFESTGCVAAADYDGDGDQDLFVGIRLRPFLYGVPVNGYLLENDGSGRFTDRTKERAPGLEELGMITDAEWLDYDGDGHPDLLLAGEWMPLRLFANRDGRMVDISSAAGMSGISGLWNCLRSGDFNGDGRPDIVAGNHGLNSRLHASPEQPLSMYVNDFDGNGMAEQLITVYNGSTAYPLTLRHDLVMQMPSLKKKYLKYEDYKEQTIEDLFPAELLARSVQLTATELRTWVLLSRPDGTYALAPLPLEAQLSPVYGMAVDDFDGDGAADILLGGNFYRAKPEVGIHDASYGLFLRGDGRGGFETVPARRSGFFLQGEVRDMALLPISGVPTVLVARNDAPLEVFSYQLRKEQ